MARTPSFDTRTPVDFVIIGSGAAGGILAKELSTAGFEVVVLEQGPYLKQQDFKHDELGYFFNSELIGGPSDNPQTFRRTDKEKAEIQNAPLPLVYARMVGGSSAHWTANAWRFHPEEFREKSLWGPIDGANVADWPITYEELEPYYTKVDWEIGVSGAVGPFDPPRSRPYPMPPLPVKSSGVLLEKGAKSLGLHAQPAPMAILSQPFNNRPSCIHCGFCIGYGCEIGAKSSSLSAMIPLAEATGRCEIRPNSTVIRLEVNDKGRIEEVVYLDENNVEHAQRAKTVILSANGAETARLLLMSESSVFPDGLANSSGMVGKNLMFNGNVNVMGKFPEPLNEYKSVQVTRIIHDFYDTDPKRGFYGGGAIDARTMFHSSPIFFGLTGLPYDAPTWGSEYKKMLSENFTRTVKFDGHCSSLPRESNNITLDPEVKDSKGRPAIRTTYQDHPDDLKVLSFLKPIMLDMMEAAGAEKIWADEVIEAEVGAHLLGTCRMGHDPKSSVVDANHKSHDIPNLFICDGSSLVSSGRGQPTMTIMALAFRAAEKIIAFAKKGDV